MRWRGSVFWMALLGGRKSGDEPRLENQFTRTLYRHALLKSKGWIHIIDRDNCNMRLETSRDFMVTGCKSNRCSN